MKYSSLILPAAAWLFLCGQSIAALQIGTPVWGFDGGVVPFSFNLVSIEVRNQGPQPFDGDLTLDDGAGMGSRSSAPLKQRIFLAPGTSRWVQFYPYIGNFNPSWRLAWDDGRSHSEDLGQASEGPPATVFLANPGSPGLRSARMKVFPEQLFPPTVAATDALEGVVLGHQPRWDPPRREAFLDWVRRGGVVHLVNGVDGALPQFTEDLAVLNTPGTDDCVGAGRVVKHPGLTAAEATEQSIRGTLFPKREIRTDGKGNIYDPDGFAFHRLAAVTRPNIAWGVIYFLTVVYVVLIGPVFFFLRKRDYRVLLAAFLVTVAVFAYAFTVIGRRGYGEKQIYHSLAIARPLGGGRFDVREWVHAFATKSDIYRFKHAGGSHLYAALGEGETVRGEVTLGKDAQFAADIPLFSSRPFLHAGVMKADDPGIKVERWEPPVTEGVASKPVKALHITANAEFRKHVLSAVLDYGGHYYKLQATGDGFGLDADAAPKAAEEFFSGQNFYDYGGRWYGDSPGDAEAALQKLRELQQVFIARVNGEAVYSRKYVKAAPLPAGQGRLFFYAETPPGFRIQNEAFQPGKGFVLYVIDIFKP